MIRIVFGVLLALVGGVWIAQGTGALHGSFMTGEAIWAVIGGLCVLAAIALITSGIRLHRSTRPPS
jgi:hypothetical protein